MQIGFRGRQYHAVRCVAISLLERLPADRQTVVAAARGTVTAMTRQRHDGIDHPVCLRHMA